MRPLIDKIRYLFDLVVGSYRREGFYQLFLSFLGRLYTYQIWCVYQHELNDLSGRKEKDLLPQIPDFSFRIITDIDQAEELARNGSDLIKKAGKLRHRLKNGALAFCLFHGSKLMHIGWLGMDAKAKDSITDVPYGVDFTNMACIEVATTIPEYRGKNAARYFKSYKGFLAYSYFKRAQYLADRGTRFARYAILENNRASRWIVERYNARVISKIRHIKFLGFKFWKERPV